ncbi:MAG: gamma-glutamyltransferase family protein [Candidatus Binatia bacterium]
MAYRPTLMGTRGMIATEHYLSADAGMRMLHAGGNAFDAAVAATLAEGVLNPHMHTFGGEISALVYSAKEKGVFSVNGDTVAPQAATINWFKQHEIKLIPFNGVLAAGPCAAPDALLSVLARFGTLSFTQVVQPALELAEGGFPLHKALRGPAPAYMLSDFSIAGNAEHFRKAWPSSAKVYLPGNRLPDVGEVLKNPDLGRTFRRLIDAEKKEEGQGRAHGLAAARDAFYKGEIAQLIAAHAQAQGGLLTAEDLANFRCKIEAPVTLNYRGYDVYKCGPWSQGPVFLQQLAILEGYDLKGLGHNSADYIHTIAETMKLAFADREQYYGDPDFVEVPLAGLLGKEYATKRRALIDPHRASLEQRPGDPRTGAALLQGEEIFAARNWGPGTVYVTVVDNERNMASFTPSGAWIPSSPVIEGLGFPLGTRVQTFYLDARHPNALVPGKRPRTTLTPTLIMKNGEPCMVFGTPGGDQQDQWTLQFFLNVVEFGMPVQDAIEAPRFSSAHFPSSFYPHNAVPGLLRIEERVPAEVRHELAARGHKLEVKEEWSEGDVLGIYVDVEQGVVHGGADPRGEQSKRMPSYVLGW